MFGQIQKHLFSEKDKSGNGHENIKSIAGFVYSFNIPFSRAFHSLSSGTGASMLICFFETG